MNVGLKIFLAALVLTAPWQVASGEAAPSDSLKEKLRQHYKPIKFDAGKQEPFRLKSGAVAVVQQPGILSVSEADATFLEVCPSTFRANTVVPTTGSFCSDLAKRSQRTLQVSERVYVTNIVVGPADKIRFYLAKCESCPPDKPPVLYHSLLILAFPKGYLAKADAEEVVRSADLVLNVEAAPESINQNGSTPDLAGELHSSDSERKSSSEQPSANALSMVPTLKKGQTPEQVIAVLGNPDTIADLGTRLLYVYRNLRISFIGGKLTDVQ